VVPACTPLVILDGGIHATTWGSATVHPPSTPACPPHTPTPNRQDRPVRRFRVAAPLHAAVAAGPRAVQGAGHHRAAAGDGAERRRAGGKVAVRSAGGGAAGGRGGERREEGAVR